MRERSSEVSAARQRRKVTLYVAVSLDGYLAPCAGATEAFAPDLANEIGYAEFVAGIDTLVMGRKTYEHLRSRPSWPGEGRRCVVLSRTRAGQKDGEVQFIEGDVADVVTGLQREPGRGLWVLGGAEMVAPCLASGMFDEIIVSISPILLGEGTPLFLPIARSTALRLLKSEAQSGGVMRLTYEVAEQANQ